MTDHCPICCPICPAPRRLGWWEYALVVAAGFVVGWMQGA